MSRIIQSNSRTNGIRRALYLRPPWCSPLPSRTLFILGCQRSGTTMVSRVFDALPYCKVYGEYNGLVNPLDGPGALQVADLDALSGNLNAHRQPFKVMKPLVDSHRALDLLRAVQGSTILWLVRGFRAVAASNVAKFGNWTGEGGQLHALVAGEPHDWRAQGTSDSTRRLLAEFVDARPNPTEAACLFWYARNQLYFEQGLDQNPRAVLWRYETFVERPAGKTNSLLEELGYPKASARATRAVFGARASADQGSRESVSEDIVTLCEELEARFDRVRNPHREREPGCI